MSPTHRIPARLIRCTSLCVCFALILSAVAGIPIQTVSSKESIRPPQQGNAQGNNGQERRVNPPTTRTGPPARSLPNLDDLRHRRAEAPRAPIALASTLRSRRKPLESRNGRRVGDPLAPVVRPTPMPTPTALPTATVVPTPRAEELTKTVVDGGPILLAHNLFSREFMEFRLFSRNGVLTPYSFLPISDSFARLRSLTETTVDVTAAPIPQAGGAKIVFASSRDGFMQIYVMNSAGNGQARLTTDGSNNQNPRWSPNGTKVLFQSDRDSPGSGLYDIYVMNADGSGQTRLTADANDDCYPSWSGDGTKIVFQSLRNGVNYQIYTMNADGSGQTNVSNNAVNDTQPSWSAAGKIAFASDRDQPGYPSIYWMNSNGTSQTRLTFSGTGLCDEQPVWSPNGIKLAFTRTRDSVLESWQETDDYEIPEDDGQLFNKSRLKINKEVYLMNADGSGQTRLTFAQENDDSACWSPDGMKIVFRSERERDVFDATPQIWTMNADGTSQANLSNSGDGDSSPSWASGSANQSPVANAGGPYSGVVGQNAPFSGSGSYDQDGSIVSYAWTFGDGARGSGVAPTHAYGSTGTFTVTLTVSDNLGAQATASTTISVSASTSDQYVTSFLQLGLGRPPTGPESTYWTDIIRAAYPKGFSSMQLAMRELGMTVFESAEYTARNRNDHWYVYDLYKAFLMREPDVQGWANWEAAVPIYGREQVRRAFHESTEFANIVATLNASGSPSAAVSSLATARVDLFNQSGNQLQARDAEWGVSLISLPGRAGLDLGLGLSYSSLVWTQSGPYMYFDADSDSPSPGFHIGFPTVQEKYFDAKVGTNVYLLTTAAGRRVELRQVGTSNVYESADSSYLQLIAGGSLVVRTTDGTSLTFGWFNNEYRCTAIEDRNGNYMLINYDWRGDIQNITDTLGRAITFNYDTNANLNSITQTWNGITHTWATFGWDTLTMQPALANVVGTYGGETIPALKTVGFDDGSYAKFLYNGNGQVTRITNYASDSNPATDNHPRNYTVFDYDAATNDCPRLTATRTWAEYWTGLNGVPTEVTSYFGVEGDARVLTAPDGTVYKETYAGSSDAAWMRGLVKSSEVWSSGVQQKLSTIAWTQDNTSVNYKTNPRVTETNVYDSVGNRRRATIDYGPYAQWGLPYLVKEYAADGTEIRHTFTDYNLSQQYLDRRIIGLVSNVHVSNAAEWQLRISYGYDDSSKITSQATTATMHDQSYDGLFTVRGNVTSVSKWDVTDIGNASKALTTTMSYNAAGSVLSTTDPAGHTSFVGYADSFSDGNNLRNTFAYPTTLTDADGFTSTLQYNFDFGAKTRVEGPPPQNQPNGYIQTFAYDSAARLERATTLNSGAYTHYEYGPNYIKTFTTVNNVAADYHFADLYTTQVFDGVGRAFTTTTNHPGSVGGYKLVNVIFDKMGRAFLQSNPTEVNSSWLPAGDDADGVHYSLLTFDWKGRTRRTIHTDGTYTEASYSGCGCAGSEVATLTDEMNRQSKVYSDVLGRTWKTEVITWPDENNNRIVYSTTTNTFNARDQVTLIRQWAGAENGGGAYQDTTMSYDGYGRLQSKHVPEQNAGTATVFAYNSDDTIDSVTDARGASATYSYNNNRHLATGITYGAPSGITPTSTVTFGYDAVGNRTSMSDGMGSASYSYNQLSQMTSETRSFTGLGSFTLGYDYNLGGQLKSITDPFNATINYGYDSAGLLSSVTGTSFGGVTTYASNPEYRAWGALKSLVYGNSKTLSIGYNNRLMPSSYEVPGILKKSYQRNNDGSIQFTQDQLVTNSKFDRSYTYDHMGRVSTALTGAEARGGGPTNDRPYKDSLAYDALGHLTTLDRLHWDRADGFGPQTFVNNRVSGWIYDADGRLTSGSTGYFTYDAAGRAISFGDNDPYKTDQEFTGDGRRAKTIARRFDDELDAWVIDKITYYVTSSVLGGALVSELSEQGAKERTSVFAGGSELASQRVLDGTQSVEWQHQDASGASYRATDVSGQGVNVKEMDPLGANAGLIKPPTWNVPDKQGLTVPYPELADMILHPGGACTIDRMPIPCEIFNNLMRAGNVEVEQMFREPQTTVDQPTLPSSRGTRHETEWVLTTGRGAIESLGIGLFRARIQTGWRADELTPLFERVLFSIAPQRGIRPPIPLAKQTAESALMDCRVKAMLEAIAWAEGTTDDADDGYGRVVRGTVLSAPDNPALVGQTNVTVTDLTHHPNILVQVSAGLSSTAAGRYQFLNRTWSGLGLSDFTAHNQDVGAVMLLRRGGAMRFIDKGDIEGAVSQVNGTWASLPGSPHGQGTRTMSDFQGQYDNALANCQSVRGMTIR
jgi:YD repeat-containing protein